MPSSFSFLCILLFAVHMSPCLSHDLDAVSRPESVNSSSLLVEQRRYRGLQQNSSACQICSYNTKQQRLFDSLPETVFLLHSGFLTLSTFILSDDNNEEKKK